LATAELKPLVEGLLFAAEGPVRPEQIAATLEIERSEAAAILQGLAEEYRRAGRGFVVEQVAGGYQFRTRPEHSRWLRRFRKSRAFRFSRQALETLAIVAYRQPVTRADIDYLRGVDSGGVLKTLLDKRLVRILGKKDIPGRPLLYGTSSEFLELFGLRDLGGLPSLKEFSDLSAELVEELESRSETEKSAEC
jgi:segregation and condensation protein B